MQSNGSVIRNQTVLSPTHVWDTAKGWARRHMTRGAMLDAVLTLVTIGSAGFVLLSLHRIFTNYTVTGF